MKTVVGLFDDLSDARAVVSELVDAGFDRNDISLVASDQDKVYSGYLDRDRDVDAELAAEEGAEGALAGAVTGGAIGGLAGVLLGLGALAIPGVGPIVAAGPIVAGLTGAGIGSVVGGLTGALVSWGIPEEEAGYYAEGIRRGGTLVGVKTDDGRVSQAVAIMNDHGPIDVSERSEYWRESGWTGYDANAPAYTREEIEAERGRYGIGGDDPYEMDDSYPVYGDYETYAPTFRQHYSNMYGTTGRDYSWYEPAYHYGYTLATDDQYNRYSDWNSLEAEARRGWESAEDTTGGAWEEFKDSVRHAWEQVKDAVSDDGYDDYVDRSRRNWDDTNGHSNRRNDAAYQDVARTGGGVVTAAGSGMPAAGVDMTRGVYPDFRTHYAMTYETTGRDYDYYEPAYRFGHDLATDKFYSDYRWMEVEPEVRRHWEETNQGSWEEFKDAVRHAWDEAKEAVR